MSETTGQKLTKPRPLTDDSIDEFILDLHNYIIHNPLLFDPNYEDEGYDHLYDYVWKQLDQFSNGERNWN